MSERYQYVRDLDQWLYNKRAPFPGALTAPLFRVPNLLCFWAAPFAQHGINWADLTGHGQYLTGHFTAIQTGVDISSSWPGAVAPYYYVGTTSVTPFYDNDTWLVDYYGGPLTIAAWVKMPALTWTGGDTAQNVLSLPVDGFFRLRYVEASTNFIWEVSTNGLMNEGYTAATAAASAETWHFVVGQYEASTSIRIRMDDNDWVSYAGAVPAALYALTPPGIYALWDASASEGTDVNIRGSQIWVANYVVPDVLLDWLWAIQSPYFGRA